jgi:lysophospholipase L1-like esterase
MEKNTFTKSPITTIIVFSIFLIFLIEIFSFCFLFFSDFFKKTKNFQKFDIQTYYNHIPNSKLVFEESKNSTNNEVVWEMDEFGLVKTINVPNYNNLPEKKVVIFGGSTVFGIGASSLENTIPSFLSVFLNNDKEEFYYKIYNAGSRGYFSYQEFLHYLNDIRSSLNPDIVISLNGRNDFFYGIHGKLKENYDTDYATKVENYVIRNIKKRYYNFFPNTTSVLKKIMKKISKKIEYLKNDKKKYIEYADNKELETSIDNYQKIMNTFKYYVEENDKKKFLWILQPTALYKKKLTRKEKESIRSSNSFNDKIQYSYNYLKKVNNKNYTDLSAIFEDEIKDIYLDNVHYNDLGNKIMARKIAELISSK